VERGWKVEVKGNGEMREEAKCVIYIGKGIRS
jgi:hypothetical protein